MHYCTLQQSVCLKIAQIPFLVGLLTPHPVPSFPVQLRSGFETPKNPRLLTWVSVIWGAIQPMFL